MAYTMGRFLPERYKPAFYDSAVSFVHPITGIFPHANAGELFVYLGIAGGHHHARPHASDLAVRYLLVGLVVILIRGIVTELITARMIAAQGRGRGGGGMSTTDTKQASGGSGMDTFNNVLVTVGKAVGGVVGTLYQAGRDTIDTVIRNILPFMAFISVLIGIINETGLGDWLAHLIEPLASSLVGLLVISIFCAIPILSPMLGPARSSPRSSACCSAPGSARATSRRSTRCRRCSRSTPRSAATSSRWVSRWARPSQKTVEVGVPAVLFSRLFTGPLSVVIAYLASFGLYQHEQLTSRTQRPNREENHMS